MTDSLYRFRLTGKAHSLFNRVRFESGTLSKWEIDPFGAAVEYDPDIGRFRFVSQKETNQLASNNVRKQQLDDLLDYYEKYKKLKAEVMGTDDSKKIKDKLVERMENLINEITIPICADGSCETASNPYELECTQVRRGFQILGPEGWRTFNPDERLIMAMSSSGEPLISVMKEVATRMLEKEVSPSERLLPLVEERLTVSQIERSIDAKGAKIEETDSSAIVQGVLDSLNKQ